MGQIAYNQLKNSRTKSIALGLMLLLINGFMFYIISLNAADGKPTNTFSYLILFFIVGGLVLLTALIPFGQVVESKEMEFETYYRLGRFKFIRHNWGQVDNVSLEQDTERFYCLKIRTVSGKSFEIEKYPTLDKANVRLSEFKRLFE